LRGLTRRLATERMGVLRRRVVVIIYIYIYKLKITYVCKSVTAKYLFYFRVINHGSGKALAPLRSASTSNAASSPPYYTNYNPA
jgi:hypothetical protein